MLLENQEALIVGGSRGIGKAVALEFARQGASVAVTGAHEEGARATASEIRSKFRVKSIGFGVDVANKSEVDRLFSEVAKQFNRLDILVYSVGIIFPFPKGVLLRKPALEISEDEWKRVIDINLTGAFLCCQNAAKIMAKQGFGRIINISSNNGILPSRGRAPYSASKAGLTMLTKVLALEWISLGIRVNEISPGAVETDIVYDQIKSGVLSEVEMKKLAPVGRMGKPEEIAQAALFLATNDYIVGASIVMDGGRVLL